MPTESIMVLGLVVGALVEFAAVLSYAEWATRQTWDVNTPCAHAGPNATDSHDHASPIRKAA